MVGSILTVNPACSNKTTFSVIQSALSSKKYQSP